MPSRTSKRLYFRGISKDVTEDELFKYLSRYGQINEVKMLSNYAFVQFESEHEALAVLETYKHQPLLDSRVVVEFAHPLRKDVASFSSSNGSPQSRSAPRVIYARHPVVVLGLPRDIRWQELKDFGRSSGMLVAFCDLDKTHDGQGFIEFFTRKDAQLAIQTLDGKLLGGHKVRVVNHEDIHDSLRVTRSRRDRSRSRSPRRQDRLTFDPLSIRRDCFPPRRLPTAEEYREQRYACKPMNPRQQPRILFEEYTNWAYQVADGSIGSLERTSSDFYEDQYYMRAYHDDAYKPYDPREGCHQFERLLDPYQ